MHIFLHFRKKGRVNHTPKARLPDLLQQGSRAEIKTGVDGNHSNIEDIKIEHDIRIVNQLVDNAEDVADDEHDQKDRTLAAGGSAGVGTVDRKRPGGTEAEQHCHLINAHNSYLPTSMSQYVCLSILRFLLSWL